MKGLSARQDQARSEMQSLYLGLVRPLGRSPLGLVSRTCFASLSWSILYTWSNQRSCDLSFRTSAWTFRLPRIWQLHTLSRNATLGA